MRSAINEFHEGLFKKNKLKKKKKKSLLCAFVCLSLGLKKTGDFTSSEGHGYPLVYIEQVTQLIVDVFLPLDIKVFGCFH
jgi:hypothetical protein